ncbi:MAG: hypothetical protein ITG02_12620 [Patulibacter sp.]|nr:hypothetical protein [Patulibacter sp.]
MRTFSNRKAATAVAVLIAAGAGTATATTIAGSSPAGPAAPAPDVSAPVVDVAEHPAPRYTAVARSAQPATRRVAEMHAVLAVRYPDVAGRPVRGIRAADGTQAWVVTGPKHTCFGADNGDGTGYSCRANVSADEGLSIVETRRDGTARSVILVPDRVASVDVAGARTAATNNLVVVEHLVGATVRATPSDGGAPFQVGKD